MTCCEQEVAIFCIHFIQKQRESHIVRNQCTVTYQMIPEVLFFLLNRSCIVFPLLQANAYRHFVLWRNQSEKGCHIYKKKGHFLNRKLIILSYFRQDYIEIKYFLIRMNKPTSGYY